MYEEILYSQDDAWELGVLHAAGHAGCELVEGHAYHEYWLAGIHDRNNLTLSRIEQLATLWNCYG